MDVPHTFRLLTLVAMLSGGGVAHAQTSPVPAPAPPPPLGTPAIDASSLLQAGTTEWLATVGSAWGVVLFHSAGGHQYLSQTVSWGRILSGPKFPGVLRGRFEWAMEVTPVFAQYRPDDVYGLGVAPICWRWNFEPRGKYAPYAELAGGLMWSSAPVPEETTTANFTAHAGAGVRMLIRKHEALVVAYRLDHISNGNRLERNPGVNAHAIHVGLSLLRPGK